MRVDRFLAWSPDGTRIAVLSNDDCQFDFRVDHYYVATGEQRLYATWGADCCGYLDWTDLFWGPGNQFGYSQRDRGQYGEVTNAPTYIVYPGFRSLAGDTGGALALGGLHGADQRVLRDGDDHPRPVGRHGSPDAGRRLPAGLAGATALTPSVGPPRQH